MINKKIAVHVTNEEQWDEVREHYKMNRKFLWESMPEGVTTVIENGKYAVLDYVKIHFDEYELLEFNEWKKLVKKQYKSLAEIQETIVNILNDITQATEEGDMTVKEFTASKIVIEQFAEELLDGDNLEWHKEQVERRHNGFSTEF